MFCFCASWDWQSRTWFGFAFLFGRHRIPEILDAAKMRPVMEKNFAPLRHLQFIRDVLSNVWSLWFRVIQVAMQTMIPHGLGPPLEPLEVNVVFVFFVC